MALQMSKKNNTATISDLRDFNGILKKVRERDSKLKFERFGEREDVIIVGIADTSFKTEDKAMGGVFLFIANTNMTRAAPIYWKSNRLIESVIV